MASEDALTTWVRAEDEDGNIVCSRELTEEEIEDGRVRLQVPIKVRSDIPLSAEWCEPEAKGIAMMALELATTGATSLKLYLGECDNEHPKS